MKNLLPIVVVSFLLLQSCNKVADPAVFEQPQPGDQSTLSSIPKKLIGTYKSLTDSSYLIIDDKEIILKELFYDTVPLKDMAEARKTATKDTVYKATNGNLTVKTVDGRIYQRAESSDTLYYPSDQYVLKKARGYYFFNEQFFKNKWTVRTLRVTSSGLLISKLRTKENITTLEDVGSVEPDSLHSSTPTKDELKSFLKDEKYKEERKFVKITGTEPKY